MLVAVFAVPRGAGPSSRLFRAQEEWAEMADRYARPPSVPTEDPGGADEPRDVENPLRPPPDRLTTGLLAAF